MTLSSFSSLLRISLIRIIENGFVSVCSIHFVGIIEYVFFKLILTLSSFSSSLRFSLIGIIESGFVIHSRNH